MFRDMFLQKETESEHAYLREMLLNTTKAGKIQLEICNALQSPTMG